MKMIVGLGNIGTQYEKTRHNVGFMLLDFIARKMEWGEFGLKSEMKAEIIKQDQMLLVKPQTMMNLSGQSVRQIANFYKIEPRDIMLVHDDLDIGFGLWKCQMGKGPKIHNGVNSVEGELGTKDFWRVRIGVDGRTPQIRGKIPPDDYVLSDFTKEESQNLKIIFDEIFDYLEDNWLNERS